MCIDFSAAWNNVLKWLVYLLPNKTIEKVVVLVDAVTVLVKLNS